MMIEIAHKKTKIANRFFSTASQNISEMKIVQLYSFLTSNGINHGWVHLCAILNGLFFVKKSYKFAINNEMYQNQQPIHVSKQSEKSCNF